jgi:hypothetical protein
MPLVEYRSFTNGIAVVHVAEKSDS